MKELTNRYILYMGIGILVVVLSVVGVTFAYFQREDVLEENNIASTVTCVGIGMTEVTESINLAAAYPMTDAQGLASNPYTFTLNNECTTYTEYMVVASIVNNVNNIPLEYIKMSLDGDTQISPTILENLPVENAPSGISNIAKTFRLAEGAFRADGTATYSLRMWLDGENDDVWNDESLSGTGLRVKITVVGIARRYYNIASANVAITPPVAAVAPSSVAFGERGYSVTSVTWSPTDGVFMIGRVYTVTVVLTADTNADFASLVSEDVKINNQLATIVSQSNESVTLTYTFAPVAPQAPAQ